jgi:hypothetical protein
MYTASSEIPARNEIANAARTIRSARRSSAGVERPGH